MDGGGEGLAGSLAFSPLPVGVKWEGSSVRMMDIAKLSVG